MLTEGLQPQSCVSRARENVLLYVQLINNGYLHTLTAEAGSKMDHMEGKA